jgi:hypothetical protein
MSRRQFSANKSRVSCGNQNTISMLRHIISQMNLAHILKLCIFKTHFNIVIISTLGPYTWSLLFSLSVMSCILCVRPSHVLHAPPMLCCLKCRAATRHTGFMTRARYLLVLLIERIGVREVCPLTLSLIISCTDRPFSVSAGRFWYTT